jgi:hypothetical protein
MLNEAGMQIPEGLAQARRFLGEISLFLQAADGMLEEVGWECSSGNRCTDLTGHVLRPKEWMPRTLHRFYGLPVGDEGGEGKLVTLFLGVLLDRAPGGGGFQEPWLTYGLFEHLIDYRYTWSEWVEASLDDGHEPDGIFHFGDKSSEDPGYDPALYHQVMAGIPLISIESSDDLKRIVIDPLLRVAQERSGRRTDQ